MCVSGLLVKVQIKYMWYANVMNKQDVLSITYDSFFSDGFTLSAEASIKYKLIIMQFSNPLLCLIYTGFKQKL